ncbi:MAG: MFS transporter [Gammaproteobacteria bacterium]|nr:MFS transporter [Gammaproteobacteria bacterium]
MLATILSVLSLLLSYGLLLLGNGLFATLLGVRTQIEGFSSVSVGFIVAAYFTGLLVGAFHTPRVVARVGHIRAFAAFASIMSVTALLPVLIIHPALWAVSRMASGFCMAGMILVTESWLNERATNANRGQVLSLYMITNYFAAGCGQLLLPISDPSRFQLFSIASIIFSLSLVPVLLTRATAPIPKPPKKIRFDELWRTSPLGFMGALCAGLVNSVFHGLGAVFAHGIGMSITQTSTFMATAIFGGLALQWPIGRLSDRVDRRWIMVGVAAATALTCIGVVAVVGRYTPALYAFAALYGGLSFTIYSLSAAHTNDFSDPARRVETASALLVAYGIGASVGPLVASAVMGAVGPSGLFMYSAIINVFLVLFGVYRMRRRATKTKQERSGMINLPGGQFTAGKLYAGMRNQMDRDLAQMTGAVRPKDWE